MQSRINEIKTRIDRAARKNGRSAHDITLVAVSKMVDNEAVRRAYDLGIHDFGENRVQELNRKVESLPQAKWHMIGRLQTNKVKDVAGKCCLIHSVDRWDLAQAIDKRGHFLDIKVPVLLQVNISGEESKAGLERGEVQNFLQSAGELTNLHILGFMTIAVLSGDPEASRPVFRELAALRKSLAGNKYGNGNVDLKYLSMGMSQDYEIAVEEGANIVRIGSALFT